MDGEYRTVRQGYVSKKPFVALYESAGLSDWREVHMSIFPWSKRFNLSAEPILDYITSVFKNVHLEFSLVGLYLSICPQMETAMSH